MEEERRLAFVALTRAEKGLFLTCADGAGHDGMPRYPSRFILDIDPDYLAFETPLEDSLVKDAHAYVRLKDRQLDQAEGAALLSTGARVDHPVFGAGTVIGVDAENASYEIQFDNMGTTRTMAARAFAKR